MRPAPFRQWQRATCGEIYDEAICRYPLRGHPGRLNLPELRLALM